MPQLGDGDRAIDRQFLGPQLSARQIDRGRTLGQESGRPHIVGEDLDVGAGCEMPGHFQCGGADIDADGSACPHQAGGCFADPCLGVGIAAATRLEGGFVAVKGLGRAEFAGHGPAMGAHQQALAFEPGEVAANGDFGDAQLGRDLAYGGKAAPFNEIAQDSVPDGRWLSIGPALGAFIGAIVHELSTTRMINFDHTRRVTRKIQHNGP
jgi:hypothetical protein